MQDNCGWTHRIFTKHGQRSAFLELPLRVKLEDETFLQDGLLLNREHNEREIAQEDEVLEVSFIETQV